MYYVYIYKTPINITVSHMTILSGQPFYIGKGIGKRYKSHLKETLKNTSNHLKVAVIDRIVKLGFTPIIEIYRDQLTDKHAKDLEIELIQKYGRLVDYAGPLTNKTLGGDGCFGFRHTEETKNLFKVQRKGKTPYNKGVARPGIGGRKLGTGWSDEERKKHEAIRSQPGYYDYAKNPERTKKISESKKGKPGPSTGKSWYNNGTIETYSFDCPDGFIKGRLPKKHNNKLGLLWYNNRIINKQYKKDEQPEEFIRGRITKK
jgi:hypothetical protein